MVHKLMYLDATRKRTAEKVLARGSEIVAREESGVSTDTLCFGTPMKPTLMSTLS